MANGILSQAPNISGLVAAGGDLGTNIQGLISTFGSLSPQSAGSPLAAISSNFINLSGRLNIDVRPLTEQLPNVLQTIQNALPANTLDYIETIGESYSTVSNLLQDSALARQISAGGSLQEVALAVIADAQQLFDQQLDELTGNLIDPDSLALLRTAFEAIEQFETDFPAHQAEFLPFVSRYLMGIGPDLLDAPLAHRETALSVLAPLQPAALASTVTPAHQAITAAYSGLITAVQSLDPAEAGHYAEIQLRLDDLEEAGELAFTALNSLYQGMEGAINSHAWDSIFGIYVELLEAIAIGDVITVDDIIATMVGMLEEMVARVYMVFEADELRRRLELLNQTIRDTVVSSPVGQIQPTLQGYLEDIRQAIEAIPTEAIQEAVESLLNRVNEAVASLQITQIQEEIAQAFQEAETFVTNNINEALKNNVRSVLVPLVSQVQNLPITGLINDLSDAVGQLQGLITQLENAVQSELENLKNLLKQLETLSFRPVSAEVIVEIDELKTRLAAINPNALSDVEKLAIKGALAVLEAIDLEGVVITGLKEAYHLAEGEVKSLLNQIIAALNRLRDQFFVFKPETLLKPINDVLDQAADLIERLNGAILLQILYEQLDNLKALLETIAPGRLLDPLQAPYQALIAGLERLNPTQLIAPLESLYEQIDSLIDRVDITPIFDELDRLRRQMFSRIRTTILSALDNLDLPQPLAGFFTEMRPILELMTEAIFGEPETELRQLGLEIRNRVNLSRLFAPLDEAFLNLIRLLESIPPAELTAAMNAIRQSIGVGLELLNPQTIIDQLRNGYGRLAELGPANLLGVTFNLPALKLAFEARVAGAPAERQSDILAISARFDLVFSLVTPEIPAGRMEQLIQTHRNVQESLRLRINALNYSQASEHYGQLRRNLDRLLPDFLRQPEPLSHADIIAGVYNMRPSTKARQVEEALARFLQRVQPMEAALEPAVNDFFAAIHDIMNLISPLAIKDSVTAIYDTIRAKVRIIDPALLRTALSDIWDTVTAALDTINPAQIKAQLDAAYSRVLAAVTGTVKEVIDDLVAIIDEQLRAIRAALKGLLDQVKAAITTLLQGLEGIIDQFEALIFVEVLDRLSRVIDNLGMSFDQELDRVRNAFDEMLAAIPLDGGASASVGV